MEKHISALQTADIPLGYRFGSEVRGSSVAGFWGVLDQVALIYVCQPYQEYDRFFVHGAGRPSLTLLGTEGHDGVGVDVNIRGMRAVYHDGLWSIGPGNEQRVEGGQVLHWEVSDAHSLTLWDEGRTFAVRGLRSRGIPQSALIRLAQSLQVE